MAIKQKGSYALMIMARTIKGAKEVVACPGNRITVVDYDGDQTVFTCDQTNGRILNNGDILVAVDDLVRGVLYWPDVPSGVQKIKAVVSLTNIAQDTESFFIGLHQN